MTRKALASSCALAIIIAALASPAFAQQVPSAQTDIADPGRIQEQFREETITPQILPEIEVREMRTRGAPEGAEKIAFKLDSLKIEGVSAYDERELSALYADKLGTTVTLADLYGIAAAMTRKYRNDGYVLTQVVVPPQTIESGTAKIQVVEGYIDRVNVQGAAGKADEIIRSYAAQIQNDNRALNVKQLERALLLINDLPGVKARSVLSPSPDNVGAANLTIFVERNPFDAMIAIDNYGSRYLGPVQLTGAVSLNNYFFDQNERITLQTAIAPDPGSGIEMAYVSASYAQPVWDQGTILEFLISANATNPGYDLDQFDVKGKSRLYSVKVEHPFIRTRELNLFGRALFDWRDVESRNNIEITREDRIRALRAGGRMDFLDTFLGVGVNSLDVEFARGLEIFGADVDNRATLSRPDADLNFFKMELEYQRLQRMTSNINLLIGVRGQWSKDALLSSEEFGVGGINLGRAFDPSEIVGDDGIAGKIELQWNRPVEWSLVQDYQVFGFFDAGRVWNDDATSTDLDRESATSAGFGVRTEFMERTSADLTVAFPLNRDVQTQQDRDPRVYFGLSRRF